MSRYESARRAGFPHESAVIFDAKSIVDDDLRALRDEFTTAELHTVLANARQDISASTILLSDLYTGLRVVARRMLIANVLLLGAFLMGVVAVFVG